MAQMAEYNNKECVENFAFCLTELDRVRVDKAQDPCRCLSKTVRPSKLRGLEHCRGQATSSPFFTFRVVFVSYSLVIFVTHPNLRGSSNCYITLRDTWRRLTASTCKNPSPSIRLSAALTNQHELVTNLPEQYFSGVENIDDFLENIDHNLAYYEIPAQLACAYLKGHLKGRALDWFEVLGYRVIEDKTTDYAHLKQALSEQFPVVRNRSELETRFYSSSQRRDQQPSDFIYELLKIHKVLKL
ncbi:uncharacterized protein TNCV_2094561 [Trichonephila clavipes]|nr:uncharacterized protein TNCV_2094561 [Trichonephila clavipes]